MKIEAGQARQNESGKLPNQSKLMDVIAGYMKPMLDDPVRYARANQSMLHTLIRHLDPEPVELPEINLSSEEVAVNEVIEAFLALASLQHALAQVEFYFRRFPFRGLPVSHADHLRNICEIYFDRIEQFRQRLKNLTKKLKTLSGKPDIRYGELVKLFSSHFEWEQKQRNNTHHTKRFEYDAIDQLGLIDLLARAPDYRHLPDTAKIYREEARKWVHRVRAHSGALQQVVEVAAGLTFEVLPEHPKASQSERNVSIATAARVELTRAFTPPPSPPA